MPFPEKGNFVIRGKQGANGLVPVPGILFIYKKYYTKNHTNRVTEHIILLHIGQYGMDNSEEYSRKMNEEGDGFEPYFTASNGERFNLTIYSRDLLNKYPRLNTFAEANSSRKFNF